MDTKSLAKSKRAHTLHHKKHHPNQKGKGVTSSVSKSGTDVIVKEKPRPTRGPPALPSNSDRYEDEDDPMTESEIDSQLSLPKDDVVRKSKGADYVYLISEAKSEKATRLPSEIFPSLDDFVSDFGQGKDAFYTARGESLLSYIQNDSFFVDDKAPAKYEASFLSLNMDALADQLAKIDLPKRLFMEADLFSLEQHSEDAQELQNVSHDRDNANINNSQANDHRDFQSSATTSISTAATRSHHQAIKDHTSGSSMNPMVHPRPNSNPNYSENQSILKSEIAETELDMLLDSFVDANLKEKPSTSKKNIVAFDIDSTLDDLLKETSNPSHEVNLIPGSVVPPSQSVSKSVLLDDFDSWLDTI